jgi:hypothetical protein
MIRIAANSLRDDILRNSTGKFSIRVRKQKIQVIVSKAFRGTIPVKYQGYDVKIKFTP